MQSKFYYIYSGENKIVHEASLSGISYTQGIFHGQLKILIAVIMMNAIC